MKVEIMNAKLNTVGTIMSSESYNYIIHVLLSATLFFAYSHGTGSDESSADVTMSMTMAMTMAMPQWQ